MANETQFPDIDPGVIISIDSEQADLLRLAHGVITGALQARQKRADPDRVISSSTNLQIKKLQALDLQLKPRYLVPHGQLSPAVRKQLQVVCELLAAGKDTMERDRAWQTLIQIVWSHGTKVRPDPQ